MVELIGIWPAATRMSINDRAEPVTPLTSGISPGAANLSRALEAMLT